MLFSMRPSSLSARATLFLRAYEPSFPNSKELDTFPV